MFQFDDIRVNERIVGDYRLVRTDPYGFWSIESKGKLPPELAGSFTDSQQAMRTLKNYEDRPKKKVK